MPERKRPRNQSRFGRRISKVRNSQSYNPRRSRNHYRTKPNSINTKRLNMYKQIARKRINALTKLHSSMPNKTNSPGFSTCISIYGRLENAKSKAEQIGLLAMLFSCLGNLGGIHSKLSNTYKYDVPVNHHLFIDGGGVNPEPSFLESIGDYGKTGLSGLFPGGREKIGRHINAGHSSTSLPIGSFEAPMGSAQVELNNSDSLKKKKKRTVKVLKPRRGKRTPPIRLNALRLTSQVQNDELMLNDPMLNDFGPNIVPNHGNVNPNYGNHV